MRNLKLFSGILSYQRSSYHNVRLSKHCVYNELTLSLLADLPIKGQEIDFLDLHSCRRQIEERKGYKDFFRGVVEGFYYYISVV